MILLEGEKEMTTLSDSALIIACFVAATTEVREQTSNKICPLCTRLNSNMISKWLHQKGVPIAINKINFYLIIQKEQFRNRANQLPVMRLISWL